LAGSPTENVTKLSFTRERMQAAERSKLRRLLSSDDFNRRRGVAMSITVSTFDLCRPVPYAGRWRRWDVEQSPFTVVDIHLCGHKLPLLSKAPRISS